MADSTTKLRDCTARLVVNDLPGMDRAKCRRLVDWLRGVAAQLDRDHKKDAKAFAHRYTASLLKE